MSSENSEYSNNDNILIFQHTIGNITFRNRNELIEYVENAQTIFRKSYDWVHDISHK